MTTVEVRCCAHPKASCTPPNASHDPHLSSYTQHPHHHPTSHIPHPTLASQPTLQPSGCRQCACVWGGGGAAVSPEHPTAVGPTIKQRPLHRRSLISVLFVPQKLSPVGVHAHTAGSACTHGAHTYPVLHTHTACTVHAHARTFCTLHTLLHTHRSHSMHTARTPHTLHAQRSVTPTSPPSAPPIRSCC